MDTYKIQEKLNSITARLHLLLTSVSRATSSHFTLVYWLTSQQQHAIGWHRSTQVVGTATHNLIDIASYSLVDIATRKWLASASEHTSG